VGRSYRRRTSLLIALVVTTTLVVFGPGNASADVQTASSGSTTAELSYTKSGSGFANVRETIIRGGSTLLDQPAGTSSTCQGCQPSVPEFLGRSAVQVLQLDASPDPEVVFDLFTGGAHCCFYSQIFGYLPGGNTYAGITQEWFDPGYRFEDLSGDGVPEFVSGLRRTGYM
jgi:hypothetical protein